LWTNPTPALPKGEEANTEIYNHTKSGAYGAALCVFLYYFHPYIPTRNSILKRLTKSIYYTNMKINIELLKTLLGIPKKF
jgi:hypothetical protein